jgi:hypothetical protein
MTSRSRGTAPGLSLRALNRATLARQMLLERAATGPAEAIQRLVALQAQLPKPPFVGLWTRLSGFRRDAIAKAVRDRTIVRATFLRGTLHLVTARDYVALRGVLQPALTAGLRAILKERADRFDLARLLSKARRFFGDAPQTFDAFRDFLVAADPEGDARAGAYATRMHLPLVQVPDDSAWAYPAVANFTLADAWIGRGIPDAAEACDARPLVRRYLAAFGPASVTDAQTWSGHKGLEPAFEALRPELTSLRDEGRREIFDLPESPRPPEEVEAPPRFLPEFDNLLLSHANRRRVLADAHRKRVFLPGLRVAATFLVDGFVAGTWTVKRTAGRAVLAIEPFGPLARPVKAALEEEGDRLLRFVEPDAPARDVRFAKAPA